jgi:SAM-dependent methyltransferase
MSYSDYTQKWINKRSSSSHLSHEYLEKPAMSDLLPDLSGKSVLCVGCGSGEECQMILGRGAKKVVGIDTNPEFIKYANETYPECEFLVMDAQKIEFETASFDFVYSSLTMHYLPDWRDFLAKLKLILKPGGEFLFSTHHPLKWGSQSIRSKEYNQFLMGYKKLKDPKAKPNFEVYGDYLNYRPITEKLFGEMEITHYHRPISQMFQEITQSGFKILDLVEPRPTKESKGVKLDFYEVYNKIPLFIIFRVKNII